jgi:hypothetical protein
VVFVIEMECGFCEVENELFFFAYHSVKLNAYKGETFIDVTKFNSIYVLPKRIK